MGAPEQVTMEGHRVTAALVFGVALLLCPLLSSAAVCPSCEATVSVGGVSVRVQFMSSTLVRVELQGEVSNYS